MFKALLLIFEPRGTWEKIYRARRGIGFIVTLYLLPLLVVVCAGEGYGLVHWGKYRGEAARLKPFSPGEAAIFEAAQFLLSLLVVFAGANMLQAIGETFRGRHPYSRAFTAIAYGLSPLFLLRLLDAFKEVNPWITWSIGIILSMSVLYYGVPRMMEPDPAHGFGLFFISSLLLVLITGMVRFVTAWYLLGKLKKVEALVSDLAARLPF